MKEFTLMDGVFVSVFSMVLVFIALALLSLIIEVFSKIINKFDKPVAGNLMSKDQIENDSQERLVAQIVASCLLQNKNPGNVRIKSIVRVK